MRLWLRTAKKSKETICERPFIRRSMSSRTCTKKYALRAKGGSMTAEIAEKVPCHWLHIEYAQRFTACPDCRRPLFRRPKEKCAKHFVWFCPECFTEKDLQTLKGIESHESENDESVED
jgi:hypothetical protein